MTNQPVSSVIVFSIPELKAMRAALDSVPWLPLDSARYQASLSAARKLGQTLHDAGGRVCSDDVIWDSTMLSFPKCIETVANTRPAPSWRGASAICGKGIRYSCDSR